MADTGTDFHVFGSGLLPHCKTRDEKKTIRQPIFGNVKVRGTAELTCMVSSSENGKMVINLEGLY